MKVAAVVGTATRTSVSGLMLGTVFSSIRTRVTRRRTPGSFVLRRTSREVTVLSFHSSMSAESSTIWTVSPAAGSHTALAISSTSPPPGSDHGTMAPRVSTAKSQSALTGSQSSRTLCAAISTGPSRMLPTVSKRTRISADSKAGSVSIRFVPAVSTTVIVGGNCANRTSVAASSPGPSTPSSSGPGPNSCATTPPPSCEARP